MEELASIRENNMSLLFNTIAQIKPVDQSLAPAIQHKLDNLTKPQGSLGRLEELALQYALIKQTLEPKLEHKLVMVVAADHGVADEGVSAFPKEVTAQMVRNFLQNGAGINVLARHTGTRVVVVDIGVAEEINTSHPALRNCKVALGTKNMVQGPAMTKAQAVSAIETGIRLVEKESGQGLDILATGEMGIANTTASSAITTVMTGRSIREVTGRGTGIDDTGWQRKASVIKKAIRVNRPRAEDTLDVLSKVGGLEIACLAGVILGGAAHNIPVVVDGFISGAAALIAYGLCPAAKDYMIASHCSVEIGHRVILKYLGLNPLMDLSLRLGEGTGAVLGINLVEAGVKIMTQMASFESAKVSQSI